MTAKEDILKYGLSRANILAAINSAKELDRIYGLNDLVKQLLGNFQYFLL